MLLLLLYIALLLTAVWNDLSNSFLCLSLTFELNQLSKFVAQAFLIYSGFHLLAEVVSRSLILLDTEKVLNFYFLILISDDSSKIEINSSGEFEFIIYYNSLILCSYRAFLSIIEWLLTSFLNSPLHYSVTLIGIWSDRCLL